MPMVFYKMDPEPNFGLHIVKIIGNSKGFQVKVKYLGSEWEDACQVRYCDYKEAEAHAQQVCKQHFTR